MVWYFSRSDNVSSFIGDRWISGLGCAPETYGKDRARDGPGGEDTSSAG
jgi:hypothetical protein